MLGPTNTRDTPWLVFLQTKFIGGACSWVGAGDLSRGGKNADQGDGGARLAAEGEVGLSVLA